MKEIIERLKSPVVVVQLLTLIGGIIVLLIPSINDQVKYITGSVVAIYQIFAGVNDPTNKMGF